MKKITGIDVSKNEFWQQDLLIEERSITKGICKRWAASTEAEINAFINTLGVDSIVVMEATGNYHRRLSDALYNQGIKVYVENPRYMKYFGKMRNNISKTDKHDALVIAHYGNVNLDRMKPYEAPRADIEALRQIKMLMEGLKKRQQAISGHLESLSQLPNVDELVKEMLEEEREEINLKIGKLQGRLNEITGHDLKKHKKILESIPGIGEKISTEFINVLSGFVGLEELGAAKKFTKFIGLAPTVHESGKSVKRGGHITRSGSPSLRAMLYMGATAAVFKTKKENPFKSFYDRLIANGKAHNKAIVAVMRKMANVAFALVRDGVTFDLAKYGVAK